MLIETITFIVYFAALLIFTFISYNKQKSDVDFVIGDRSLNFWLTALSAHASDMSNWLFMAYPAVIFVSGLFNIWLAIGLTVCMFFNWQLLAPKIREVTGKFNILTLNEYLEFRFKDKTITIRTLSASMTFIFYLFYISAGLVGLGFLVQTTFHLNYIIGITAGLAIVVFYVFIGGYKTVASIDLFQGLFLLFVILFIPTYLFIKIGNFSAIFSSLNQAHLKAFFPNFHPSTIIKILFLAFGWGLGYFGQPHIITKFMGIKNIKDMRKAQMVGISWQILALTGATLFAILGIYLFQNGLKNPESIILHIVQDNLPSFFSGLILCAILAATTNVIAAQILVVASSLSEDFYKRIIKPKASHKEILFVSKTSVILIAVISYFIAFFKITTIYKLVLFSWTGLGASFGPILLISLYFKKITSKKAAIGGILTGGLVAIIWTLSSNLIFENDIPAMIPSFTLSILAIFTIQYLDNYHKARLK